MKTLNHNVTMHVMQATRGAWCKAFFMSFLIILPYLTGLYAEINVTYCKSNLLRTQRHLLFSPKGAFKLVVGLGIPMPLPGKGRSLSHGFNFQFQYTLPVTADQLYLHESRLKGRSLRALDRNVVYATFEDVLEGKGLPGRECLLRVICEAAAAPLNHDGLLGQLTQIILNPRPGIADPEFLEANRLGEAGVRCDAAFTCPVSVLDQFSTLIN